MRRADRLFQIIQLLRRKQRGYGRDACPRAGGLGAHRLPRHPRPRAQRSPNRRRGRRRLHAAQAASTSRRSCSPRSRSRRWSSAPASSPAGAMPPWRKPPSDALARVEAALPERLRASGSTGTRLYAPGFHVPQDVAAALGTELRGSIDGRRKVFLAYTDRGRHRHRPHGAAARPLLLGQGLVARRRGASSGTTFAASAWTASASCSCSTTVSRTRPAKRWTTSSERWTKKNDGHRLGREGSARGRGR